MRPEDVFVVLSADASVVALIGGGLIGGLFGFLVSRAFAIIDDPLVQITLTTIAAYGSFALAERLSASGIIATTVAGLAQIDEKMAALRLR